MIRRGGRALVVLAYCVVFALVGSVCIGTAPAGASSKPYRIFAILSLTGPLAANSHDTLEAMQAAIKNINASGGILGHKMVMTYVDDQNSATDGLTELDNELAKGPAPNFVTTFNQETLLAVAPILAKHHLLNISANIAPTVYLHTTKYPDSFSSSNSAADQGTIMVKQIAATHPGKVGVLYSTDALGESSYAAYAPELKAAHVPFVSESYDDSSIDLTPQLQALKADGAKLLLVQGFGPSTGYALEARTQLGWKVPVVGDQAFASYPVAASVPPKDLVGVKELTYKFKVCGTALQTAPALKKMVSGMKAIGPIQSGTSAAAPFWDALYLTRTAAQQANSISTSAIVKALNNLKQPPANKRPWVQFEVENYTPQSAHFIPAVSKDYQLVQVGPNQEGNVCISPTYKP